MTYLIVLIALLNFPNESQKLHAHSRVTPSIASKARHGLRCAKGMPNCDKLTQGLTPAEYKWLYERHHWSEWRCSGCERLDEQAERAKWNGGAHCYIESGRDDATLYRKEVPCSIPTKPHRWAWLANYEGPQVEAQICLEHGETRVREWK